MKSTNSQGSFFDNESWSSQTHDDYVRSLMSRDDERAGDQCYELMKNVILFIEEIHDKEKINDLYQQAAYNSDFINTIFSMVSLPLSLDKTEVLDKNVDFSSLTEMFRRYVHYCIRRTRDDKCICMCHGYGKDSGSGSECGVAIALIVKLSELLRAEAIAITAGRFRSMRDFFASDLNQRLDRAIGDEIKACADHIHTAVRYLPQVQGIELPLDSVPCDLLLFHITMRYRVSFKTIAPKHDFAAVLQIALAISAVKAGKITSRFGVKP